MQGRTLRTEPYVDRRRQAQGRGWSLLKRVGAVTVGYVAAPRPLLSTPLLADTAAEIVDARMAKFLLQAALKTKEEEEEERKQELAEEALDDKLDAESDALMAIGPERVSSRQDARLSAVLRERGGWWRGGRRARKRRGRRSFLVLAALAADIGSGMFAMLC